MSLPLVQIDAAPAAYRPHSDPAVIHLQSGHANLLALFDGVGSWGYGMEAAAWTRLRLIERWERSVPAFIAAVAEDIATVSGAVPGEFRNTDFGCGFCGAAVLLGAGSVYVTAAGLFGVYLVNQFGLVPIFRPRMLVDQLLEEKQLSPDEIDAFAHQDVCVGPFLADGGKQALKCSGPHDLPPDHILIVAHQRLLRLLAAQPPTSWMNHSAAGLQRTGVQGKIPAYPTIVIRRLDQHSTTPQTPTSTGGAA